MAGRLTLTVLGSGDAFGSGGRNQSGYLVQARGFCMLMDCGVTTLVSLKRHRVDPTSLDLVLLTHLHGDHVAGLPFLFHDFQHAGFRKTPLRVAGPRGLKRRVEGIHRILFPPKREETRRFRAHYFSLRPGRPFQPAGRAGPEILPFRVRHQNAREDFGYRVRWKARDLAYTGDTGWFPQLPDRVRGAHLLLCECTQNSRGSRKHLSLAELREHRRELEVGSILLTHLGPELAGRRRISGFRLARDGMKILV